MNLFAFLRRRIVQMLPVLIGISAVTFFMIHLIPGDPARNMLGPRATPERKGVLRDLARTHLPRGVASRTKLGFGFDVRPYLTGAVRPVFLAEGRLRDVLGLGAAEWRASLERMSSAHALRFWTGEIWCRLMVDGEPVQAVEEQLWR